MKKFLPLLITVLLILPLISAVSTPYDSDEDYRLVDHYYDGSGEHWVYENIYTGREIYYDYHRDRPRYYRYYEDYDCYYVDGYRKCYGGRYYHKKYYRYYDYEYRGRDYEGNRYKIYRKRNGDYTYKYNDRDLGYVYKWDLHPSEYEHLEYLNE